MIIDYFYDDVKAASSQKQQSSILAAANSRRHINVVPHQMISDTSTLHHHHTHHHHTLSSILMELSTSMLNALLHALLVAGDTSNDVMGGSGEAESRGGGPPNAPSLSSSPPTLSALVLNGAILPTMSAISVTDVVSSLVSGISSSTAATIVNGSGDYIFRRSFSTPLPDGVILTTMAAAIIPAVAMTGPSLSSTSSPTFEEPPVDDWCFDLLVFYRSIAEDDAQARNVLVQLETYSKFSFAVNGIATCLLASFGLLGNILFVSQLHKSRYFSRRLASHLTVLCAWDIALLLCCLLTYGIMASYYGILPFVGIVAYLLYFFQPFASFCVTGTIWQVLAITVERYAAVSRPLEQRTRRARFSLRTICGTIAVGAFLLNMVVVPFERRLTDCYEFTQNGFRIRTMIVQQELVNNQYYAILAHLVPDIVFRAPTPIIVIAILTIQTLRICARRTTATGHRAASRHNVPFMLTLLNVKFIMCNTLYMFNTILMEVMGYGGKTSNQQTELEMEQYVKSLYLTDFSNLLLAIHSATNWLIFYHWPRFSKRKRRVAKKLSSMTLTSNAASKASSISMSATVTSGSFFSADAVNALARRFSAKKHRVATDILVALCANSPQIQRLLIGRVDASTEEAESAERKRSQSTRKSTSEDVAVANLIPEMMEERRRAAIAARLEWNDATLALRQYAVELGDSIEELLNGLANKCCSGGGASSIFEWRNQCRRVGYRNYKINLYCSAAEWKLVRAILLNAVVDDVSTKMTNGSGVNTSLDGEMVAMTPLQRVMFKAFNSALREMKSGALCAVVDATRCRQLCPQRSLNVGDLWRNSAGSMSIGGSRPCGSTMTAADGGRAFGRYGYGLPTPKDTTQYHKVASDDNLLLLSSGCHHSRDRFLCQQPSSLQLRNGINLTRASLNGHIPMNISTADGSKKSLVDVPSPSVREKRLHVRTVSRLIGQLSAVFTNKSDNDTDEQRHTSNAYDCWRKRRHENDSLAEEKRIEAPLLSLSRPPEEDTCGRAEPLLRGRGAPTTWRSTSREFRFDCTQLSNSSGSGNESTRFDCLVTERVPNTPQTAIGVTSSPAERMGGSLGGVLQQQGTPSKEK